MKSFNQFLNESYFSEEEVQGRLVNRKNQAYKDINNPNPGNRAYSSDPTPVPASRRLPAGAPAGPKASPGQMDIPKPPAGTTTKVPGSSVRGSGEMRQPSLLTRSGEAQNFTKAGKGRVPFTSSEPVKATKRLSAAAPEAPKTSPGQQVIRQTSNPPTTKALPPGPKGGALAKRAGSNPGVPDAMMRGAQDAAGKQGNVSGPSTSSKTKKPSAFKPSTVNAASSTSSSVSGGPSSNTREPKPYRNAGSSSPTTKGGALALRPTSSPSAPDGSQSNPQKIRTNMNVPGGKTATKGLGKSILKAAGKIAGPASAALDVADERSKGSGWARSLAKGATVAAGGALGGALGSAAGPVGSVGGAVGGSVAASKAFDVAAGANAKERKGMATANRQRQAGTSVKGIGGSTSFSQKKPGGPAFMSTGVGKQRSTVQLAKTGVVQRGGQSVAGNLAFKGGKAVYKAGPSAQSLAKTSSNPLERVGRSLFAGAYKKSDAANAAKKLATARSSDAARNKKLGVKFGPGK
jgi:hypothetical protein